MVLVRKLCKIWTFGDESLKPVFEQKPLFFQAFSSENLIGSERSRSDLRNRGLEVRILPGVLLKPTKTEVERDLGFFVRGSFRIRAQESQPVSRICQSHDGSALTVICGNG